MKNMIRVFREYTDRFCKLISSQFAQYCARTGMIADATLQIAFSYDAKTNTASMIVGDSDGRLYEIHHVLTALTTEQQLSDLLRYFMNVLYRQDFCTCLAEGYCRRYPDPSVSQMYQNVVRKTIDHIRVDYLMSEVLPGVLATQGYQMTKMTC